MSVSSTSPPCGRTMTPGSNTSSSSGIRTVAVILPSDPSSACPTVPRPRIRPSVAPFWRSRSGTSTALLWAVWLKALSPRVRFGSNLYKDELVDNPFCGRGRAKSDGERHRGAGDGRVGFERAADRLEQRTRLEPHLRELGLRLGTGDD